MNPVYLVLTVLASAPTALVVVVAIGVVLWMFGRDRPAAGALALGAAVIGFAELSGLGLTFLMSSGVLDGLEFDQIRLVNTLGWAVLTLVKMIGVVALIVATALGRAPREAT